MTTAEYGTQPVVAGHHGGQVVEQVADRHHAELGRGELEGERQTTASRAQCCQQRGSVLVDGQTVAAVTYPIGQQPYGIACQYGILVIRRRDRTAGRRAPSAHRGC